MGSGTSFNRSREAGDSVLVKTEHVPSAEGKSGEQRVQNRRQQGSLRKKRLRRSLPAENASGQEQDGAYEREESCEGDADQAKRQRHQPDEGEKHQREERERPRDNEQKAPDEKSNQRFHMISISLAHKRSTGESGK